MSYLLKNQEALTKFKVTYPNVRDAFEKNANQAINYLRLLGFSCANCGKSVTAPNVKFCGYEPNTKCFNCQTL